MKDLKQSYFKKTVADFIFSFDQNQDGIFDEYEQQESYDFWSSSNMQRQQHDLLGEMCFANLQTKGKGQWKKAKNGELNEDQDQDEDDEKFRTFFEFLGMNRGVLSEDSFYQAIA